MSIIVSENKAHQATVNAAESVRQTAVSAAIAAGGGSAVVRAAVITAEAAYFRAALASGLANNVQVGVFRQGLKDLTGLSQ